MCRRNSGGCPGPSFEFILLTSAVNCDGKEDADNWIGKLFMPRGSFILSGPDSSSTDPSPASVSWNEYYWIDLTWNFVDMLVIEHAERPFLAVPTALPGGVVVVGAHRGGRETDD